jgi:hypothetical protein
MPAVLRVLFTIPSASFAVRMKNNNIPRYLRSFGPKSLNRLAEHRTSEPHSGEVAIQMRRQDARNSFGEKKSLEFPLVPDTRH